MERVIRIGLLVVLIASVMGLGLISCAKEAPTPAPPTPAPPTPAPPTVHKLVFSGYHPYPAGADARGGQLCLDRIMEASGGRIVFDIHWGGTLFKLKSEYQALNSGAIDMTLTYTGVYPTIAPTTAVYEIPFQWPGPEANRDITAKGEVTALLAPEWEKENVKVICLYGTSPYDIATSKRIIKLPEDFKGLKIRTSTPTMAHWVGLCGASPSTIPVTETYMALKLGTADGLLMSRASMITRKFVEVVKYYTLYGAQTMVNGFFMNKNSYNSLPPDLQKIVVESIRTTQADFYRIVADEENADLEKAAKELGIEMYEMSAEEKAAFREKAAAPAKEFLIKEMGANPDILEKVLAIFESYR